MTDIPYAGSELDLFAAVLNWKYYWSGKVRPFINGEVLEVGAGIGSNTSLLKTDRNTPWICLEPDSRFIARLNEKIRHSDLLENCQTFCGTLEDIPKSWKFDSIVYIDVLEHIENDYEEIKLASSFLRAGGRIIVLSPAHQSLFTPFDSAIGHFRRYNKTMLRNISPPNLRIEKMFYLDAAGLALSSANRLFLHQSTPTRQQLAFWDTCVIPISRILDRVTLNCIGKTIVCVWQLTA